MFLKNVIAWKVLLFLSLLFYRPRSHAAVLVLLIIIWPQQQEMLLVQLHWSHIICIGKSFRCVSEQCTDGSYSILLDPGGLCTLVSDLNHKLLNSYMLYWCQMEGSQIFGATSTCLIQTNQGWGALATKQTWKETISFIWSKQTINGKFLINNLTSYRKINIESRKCILKIQIFDLWLWTVI